jgi:ribonuclease inhibitor
MRWIFAFLLSSSLISNAQALDCGAEKRAVTAIIQIHGENAYSAEDIHNQFAESGYFPPYYGKNLDALYDVLANFEQDLTVWWVNSDVSTQRLGHEKFTGFLDVFHDAAKNNKDYRVCLELR